MPPAELPEPEEVEKTVREIVTRYIDVSAASQDFKDAVTEAAAVMAVQIQNLLRGTEPEEYLEYDWFSLYSLDYHDGPKSEYERRRLTITGYENSSIAEDLRTYVERINPEVLTRIEEKNRKAAEGITDGTSRIGDFLCNVLELIATPVGYHLMKKIEFRMKHLVRKHGDTWNYEMAHQLYRTIYRFIKCRTLPGKDGEYEARKAAEEIYEEYCMEKKRPFIVLYDLFYDLHKYTTKHIMGYRLITIDDKIDTYTERYRTPENEWLWVSMDLAYDLQSKYHDERVGITEKGGSGTAVISFYLFEPYLALMKFRCDRLSDEAAKHQEVLDFINYQFRGYPKETFLGYPTMYRDICSYIGVTPVNLAEFEEEEKILVREHTEAKERHEATRLAAFHVQGELTTEMATKIIWDAYKY